ncbi:MAG: hypothetical protein C9356_02610 [Oleiphilus sp.]|nr:MAG: hypothetical protein C9356_02610 [Oleiphilus sp.]
MDFPTYKQLVKALTIGKKLPDSTYIHQSAFDQIDQKLSGFTLRIAKALKIDEGAWNIAKFYRNDFRISLLHYPRFDTFAYPELETSYTIDLHKLTLRPASYAESQNPPILHRKEAFLLPSDPRVGAFSKKTQEGEQIGLYENTRSIGFRNNWLRLIRSKGFVLDEAGNLQRLETVKPTLELETGQDQIDRHKTAIDRSHLSKPMQLIARHGYFEGEFSVLDYGCGKGDDVRELEAHGIDIIGWDPVHAPEVDIEKSDIVNLGFVLNVIEDREERDQTLKRAWSYSKKLLVASVMIAGESVIAKFKPYKDGVLTSRNTFQKYYAQSEFKYYLESTLDEEVIPIGQGIFAIFKDKQEQQKFLLERQHIKRAWKQKSVREVVAVSAKPVDKNLVLKNEALFQDFWNTALDLGRIPANDEFDFSEELRRISGSHAKAFKALTEFYGEEEFQRAASKRRDDLIVYFALGLFAKRQTQSKMPNSLKRDTKTFFTNITNAIDEARAVLFSVGDPAVIEDAAIAAYADFKCGEFNKGHSYVFRKELLSEAPKELRIYVGCATQLYGDLDDIQLIKVHFNSGKVSLMGYKHWDSDTPLLIERIKIKMREQDVDFFDYVGEFRPVPLENKAIF